MDKWKVFEMECCEFLNDKFRGLGYTFYNTGGSDSTSGDIAVYYNKRFIFYVEAKLSPAQSGQFVVLPQDEGNFIYSPLNEFALNKFSKEIIDFINANIDIYTNVNQSALEITCDYKHVLNWVTYHFQQKNSRFIITSTRLNGYKAIIPIENIGSYFDIKAFLRNKKSGTRDVPKKDVYIAKDLINKRFSNFKYSYKDEGKKVAVLFDSLFKPIDKSQCYIGDEFFLSKENDSKYYVKKLSSTNNPNVIFSIIYTGSHTNFGVNEFESYLKGQA